MSWSPEVSETSLNVALAELLAERGLRALGEVLMKVRPDVLLDVNGVRIVLEGKRPGFRRELVSQAQGRLDQGICEICVMVEYASVTFRTLHPTQKDVKEALGVARLNISFMTLSERAGLERWVSTQVRTPRDFQEGVDLNDLVTDLMAVYDQAVHEDILGPVVEKLDKSIQDFARNIASDNINVTRLKQVLELREGKREETEE